ncbi:MAG: hypothetical protein HGA71_11360 [Azonexaceae bacterium]|nr:hypothetical protein [Azonexaceae bacterium]
MKPIAEKNDILVTAPWAIAVFASRESVDTVENVLRSIVIACNGIETHIDVLINGNGYLAQSLGQRLRSEPIDLGREHNVCVWSVKLGDKAETWNVYVHHLHPKANITFFIDGYVQPEASSLRELAIALKDSEHALAATGVPSLGRTAERHTKAMLREGGLQGGLFALSSLAMDEIVNQRFRLPIGLYRVDSLIGAAINFNFNPATNSWAPSRIRVQPSATYRYQTLRWWRIKDLITHLKRMRRQAQGALENQAVRNHLAHNRRSPGTLPRTARELVLSWWNSEHGPGWWQIIRHPSWLLALEHFKKIQDWSAAKQNPELVFNNSDLATTPLGLSELIHGVTQDATNC